MEMTQTEKCELTYEPAIESDDNGTDEIIIFYYFGCCWYIFCIFCTVILIFIPCVIYCTLIKEAYKRVISVDKKRSF